MTKAIAVCAGTVKEFVRLLCRIAWRQWIGPRYSSTGEEYVRHRGMTVGGAVRLAWTIASGESHKVEQ